MLRTEFESERSGRLVGVAETSGKLAEWRRFQRKNFSKLSLPKRTEWPSEHMERTPKSPLPKGNGTEPPIQITRS